jgi:hypothetical protein
MRSARSLPQYRLAVCCFAFLTASAWTGDTQAGDAAPVRFSRDILPILSENCLLCHGPDAKQRKGDLRLDVKEQALRTKDPIIVPGKSDESELIRRVESDDPEEQMPPGRSGHVLTDRQKETLKRWIDQGAVWGKHWAFEPPQRVEPSSVKNGSWVRNPIDRFVLARLEQEGLAPSPEADHATLERRASLDLIGLPSTLDQLAPTGPGSYEALVDRLLASPQYGERMAIDWLDAARYADTNGYQNDFARTMWPWRDWVIAAFNQNKPFDRFVVEQIAGDLLPGAALDQKVATGFNRNNRTVTEAGSIDEEWRIENAVDRVETTATVFLGLTMGCTRCHEHKYDPISQKEFYQFLAFFAGLNEKGVYTEQRGNVPPMIPVPNASQAEKLRRLDAAIAEAERAKAEAEKGLAGREVNWERQQQAGPPPGEQLDWALRCPLDGSLRVVGPQGAEFQATYRGKPGPAWAAGPVEKALRLDSKDGAFAELPRGVSLDRTDAFSYGGWVKPTGDGAVLSKMDDRDGYRGYDLLIQDGKVAAHLVHAWPGNALKVLTREPLPREAWTHVLVTHDGSGKASGMRVFLNGRSVPLEAETDTLRGTTVTKEPVRIGRRSTSSAFKGELADIRIYRRALSESDVRELATGPLRMLARIPDAKRSAEQRTRLARGFREHVDSSLRQAEERVAMLKKQKSDFQSGHPTVMVMEDLATPRPTYVLKRGRYDQPDLSQKVEPGIPACLNPFPADAPRNRLGLARWLASADNPLTARVFVNRIWEQHFGTGLVKTAENFGLQGEPPLHPELLDWLATELVRTGWDVKALHWLIVTSATFRQSSKASPGLVKQDPENRLLARGPRFRLPAEVVRDNALAAAGLLSSAIGGPSVKPYQPAGLWEELAGGAGEGPYLQDKGEKLYRRSLYVYRKRTVPHPALASFDAPSREVCLVKRARTNTPLQALQLLNDTTYVEAARGLAERMIREGGSTLEDRLSFGFRRATGRNPGPEELRVLARGLERYRDALRPRPQAASEWLRQGEHPVPQGMEPVELAAYVATAGVILNLDETITRE